MCRPIHRQAANDPLTPRESEIYDLLGRGMGIRAISEELYIMESTARCHISHICDKLGLGRVQVAILSALEAQASNGQQQEPPEDADDSAERNAA